MALSTPGVHSRVQQHVGIVHPNRGRDRIAALVVVSKIPNPDDAREVLYALGLAEESERPARAGRERWPVGTYTLRLLPQGTSLHAVRTGHAGAACGAAPVVGKRWHVPDAAEQVDMRICVRCCRSLADGGAWRG